MDLTGIIVLNTFAIIILIIIYIHSLKHDESSFLQKKLYIMMLSVTALMLFIDIFSRLEGKPDSIYTAMNHISNFMIFLLSPVLPSIWLLYACYNIFGEEDKIRRLLYPLLAINVGHGVMLISSLPSGWLYYIDSYNIYHRGPYFLLSPSVTVALLIATFVLIVVNRSKIGKREYFSLLFFAVPPFLCIILQIAFYGVSIILSSVVLSLLIVFFNIQSHSMYIDYLTEVNNRKMLEIYLKKKISICTENKSFSAIMLDLNNFKAINDTFGHNIGDEALQISAKLLKSCLRPNDFISRFGGDEFCIVLDSSDSTVLEMIVRRINVYFRKYNKSSGQPYKLELSMGYAVYDYHSHMDAEGFQKHIDRLMYENKRNNK